MTKIIHLDECATEGLNCQQMEFRDLLDQGATMCPAVEYMRDELYFDELVWVEERNDA